LLICNSQEPSCDMILNLKSRQHKLVDKELANLKFKIIRNTLVFYINQGQKLQRRSDPEASFLTKPDRLILTYLSSNFFGNFDNSAGADISMLIFSERLTRWPCVETFSRSLTRCFRLRLVYHDQMLQLLIVASTWRLTRCLTYQ